VLVISGSCMLGVFIRFPWNGRSCVLFVRRYDEQNRFPEAKMCWSEGRTELIILNKECLGPV